MSDIYFVIETIPITKKNSSQIVINKKTGRPYIVPSAAYRKFEKAVGKLIPRELRNLNISDPCNVKTVFYMPTRRRVDKSNLEEAIHDALVSHGVMADDSRDIIATTDGSIVLYDKYRPRIEITITPLKGYEQWSQK